MKEIDQISQWGQTKTESSQAFQKDLNGLIELNVLAKKVVQTAPSKEGKVDVVFLKIDLAKPQMFFLICSSTWPSFKCSFDEFNLHVRKCATTLMSAGSAPFLFNCIRQDFGSCFDYPLYLLFISVVLTEFTNPKLISKYS